MKKRDVREGMRVELTFNIQTVAQFVGVKDTRGLVGTVTRDGDSPLVYRPISGTPEATDTDSDAYTLVVFDQNPGLEIGVPITHLRAK